MTSAMLQTLKITFKLLHKLKHILFTNSSLKTRQKLEPRLFKDYAGWLKFDFRRKTNCSFAHSEMKNLVFLRWQKLLHFPNYLIYFFDFFFLYLLLVTSTTILQKYQNNVYFYCLITLLTATSSNKNNL